METKQPDKDGSDRERGGRFSGYMITGSQAITAQDSIAANLATAALRNASLFGLRRPSVV